MRDQTVMIDASRDGWVEVNGRRHVSPHGLIPAHGGTLVDAMALPDRAAELRSLSRTMPSWDLTPRQLCDLELLLSGGFSPLTGFMGPADHESVCATMRLADGTLWPIPITLDVSDDIAGRLRIGESLALRDPEGVMLAVLRVESVWRPDRGLEAETVYGTRSLEHPGVRQLLEATHQFCVGGRLEGVEAPIHYDFKRLRLSPAQLREEFTRLGWSRVVAFQTRNPMHRAHLELTQRAAVAVGGQLLIHPVVGMTKPGDVDHAIRVRCYKALLDRYPPATTRLALLPLAMRMAGPREALWHAIIRKNHGCTHLIVGRDHAGPGSDAQGRPFYDPYAAQEMVRAHQDELGVGMVPFQMLVYAPDLDTYLEEDKVTAGTRVVTVSGTELRRKLSSGDELPEWFTYPEVARELRRSYAPRDKQGIVVFLTGLSGSGKSTIAQTLLVKLVERSSRPVTLLDGDVVRKYLSSELGFSKEHRDLNIRRIGYVASEVARHGGIAICAPIAPYDALRKEVRAMVTQQNAGFTLVHLATPIEVCEGRDRKGLYAKARAGLIAGFTGVSDPYEPPQDAEVVVDTATTSAEGVADMILGHLEIEGYLPAATVVELAS
jgi:sulfate adenylyltransferase